jgi:adenine deaminase
MSQSLSPDIRRALVDCAMGRRPADLVIRQGQWVAVQSGEVIANTDLAAVAGRIAYIGEDARHCIGPATRVIEARGRFLVPGLIDGHVHVESTMLTVTEFVRAVVPHGTTAAIIDPHEIANVFGLAGIRLMLDEAVGQPITLWVEVPSCVPSAPGLETPGSTLSPEDVAEALTWPGVIGLGEVMDYAGVVANSEKMVSEIAAAGRLGKVVSGHYPSLDLGHAFHAYAAGGIDDDHEGTRLEDGIARVRQGMRAMLRYGSGWHDVAAQVRAVTEAGLDPRRFVLVTDDSHAETLVDEGHMDRVVRHAIASGLSPMAAIQMATLNPAEHFGLSSEIGLLAPGRRADVLLVESLEGMQVEVVIAAGIMLSELGVWSIALEPRQVPVEFGRSVHLPRPMVAEDFVVKSSGNPSTEANVIGVVENQAPTRWLKRSLRVGPSGAQIDLQQDVAKVAVIDRHHRSGRMQTAFVSGFGFGPRCAVASTVAHDSHNLLVVGTDENDMATAANALAHTGGGMLVVREGRVLASVELPVGGLMSNQKVGNVAAAAGQVLAAYRACGCTMNNPNMQLSLLGLAVIPRLRLTDLGLVDVEKGAFVPVVEA